ncbi:Sec-independent protein translocase TatB [Kineosporia sp. J2-2]|uniref:Sec-independent protein translocase TatB n=1 Tax=Kineosporia corallincola TaxID=2835133 RepID=A0ABS5TH33_9ACTN|nr:Sec-independent protein translocase TatB [Kineosporia corallincola]MBT0770403.1 Sec-independent protein translocase TatB [Kineosporia corallincola]
MFGINPAEFIVLLAVAAVVLGPERLPQYAQQLARIVVELRRMAQGASRQVREELGPEFDEIDWQKLDPRQYDPRRIVREALADAWDPDDPLGLKENGYTKEGLSTDGAKPSANGAAARSSSSSSSSAPGGSEKNDDTPKPPAGTPAFDPDAT